jgi:hypothetical protein
MQAKRRVSEREMSAFGRGRVLGGMSVIALACATRVAFADPLPTPGLSASDVGTEMRIRASFAPEFTRGSVGRVSSPLVEEDQGGGSRYPSQQASSDACDNGLRDPPPTGRSEERPSIGRAMPAPTRGGGCANASDSTQMQRALEAAWARRANRQDERPLTPSCDSFAFSRPYLPRRPHDTCALSPRG